jgi:hypothetical protein
VCSLESLIIAGSNSGSIAGLNSGSNCTYTVPALVPVPVQTPCSSPIPVRSQREEPAATAADPTKSAIGSACDSEDEWDPAGEAAPRIHPPEQEEEYGDSTEPDRVIQLQFNRQHTRIPFHERDKSNIHRSGAERQVG